MSPDVVALVSVCPIAALGAVALLAWVATRRAVWAAHEVPAPARGPSPHSAPSRGPRSRP